MKKKAFFILFILFISPSLAHSMEDEEYEKYIHNIYLKHYKNPVPPEDWNRKIKSLSKKYKLKHKDNFWDLSDSLLNNPLYWSKMWVANPQVENPHLIFRGKFIKFDPRNLAFVNSSKYSVDIQTQFPHVTIPKNPFAKDALSSAEIPSSLPHLLKFRKIKDEIDISQIKEKHVKTDILVPSYLIDSAPPTIGEIVSKNSYGFFIGLAGHRLVIRLDSEITLGETVAVFENKGRIGSLLEYATGLNQDEIVIKGKIKILSYLKGTDSLYLASVIETLRPMAPGDLLLKGAPAVYNFSQKGAVGTGGGLIIGSAKKKQSLLHLGSVVYLDKGTADNVNKDEIFYIRGQAEEEKTFKRPYQYEQPVIGRLRIIHSAENVATGIIIENRDQIHVGDIWTEQSDQTQDLSQSSDHELVEDTNPLLMDYEETDEKDDRLEQQTELKIESPSPNKEDIEEEGYLKEGEKADFQVNDEDLKGADPNDFELVDDPKENKSNIEEGESNIEEGESNMEEGESNIEEGESNIEEGESNIEEGESNMEEGESNIEEGESNIEEGESNMEENENIKRDLDLELDFEAGDI